LAVGVDVARHHCPSGEEGEEVTLLSSLMVPTRTVGVVEVATVAVVVVEVDSTGPVAVLWKWRSFRKKLG
jgi:hypothetical protein